MRMCLRSECILLSTTYLLQGCSTARQTNHSIAAQKARHECDNRRDGQAYKDRGGQGSFVD
jgi:hypothetical protein